MSKKISNTNTNTSSGDSMSAGSGQPASSRLDAGRTYTGTIVSTSYNDGLYDVQIDRPSIRLQCTWAVGIFMPLTGFKTHYLPPVNTKVVVLAGPSLPIIIGMLPEATMDLQAGGSKISTSTSLGKLNSVTGTAGVCRSDSVPADFVEGEFEISNNLGVAIQFLTTLIKMQASERAKVEAFMLDDMVRIVSDTFKHISSFGDYQIYNDGRLNVRWDGTSYEHEAWGLLGAADEKADVSNRNVNFDTLSSEELTKTGRWRFSQFIGFLGDFVHCFVTDPTTSLSSIAENAQRSGKARVHINSDGTILMQSVSQISLERVCRIAVPVEKKRQDDPSGSINDDFNNLEKDYLKIWDYGTDMSKVHHASYQLREYARWLSCFHSFARFHELDKNWSIPKETDIEAPAMTCKEPDKEAANPGITEYYDTYATIRIMLDGSIVLWDGKGAAVSMVGGNLQLSAPRHIDIDAAGDIRMSAGQNIYIKARRNIELTAVTGGLTLKARAWWKALCEWGTVWIKSDAVDPLVGPVPTPDNAVQDPTPEILAAAIVLEASQGQTLVQSARRVTVSTIGQPDDTEDATDTTASVLLQSRYQDVRLLANRSVNIKSKSANNGSIIFDSGKAILVKCLKFIATVRTVFDINETFTFKGNRLNLQELRTRRLHVKQVASGPSNFGSDIADNNIPYKSHGHHLTKYDESVSPVQFAEASDVEELTNYDSGSVEEVKPHELNDAPPDGPDWAFYKEDERFKVDGQDEEVFQPLAQQRVLDDPTYTGYETWDWATDDMLKAGVRTSTTSLPFPGAGAKEKVHTGGEPLNTPLDQLYKDQNPSIATSLTNIPPVRKYLPKE